MRHLAWGSAAPIPTAPAHSVARITERIARMSSVAHLSPAEELAAFLARGPSPEEIARFRLSAAALKRARALMDKNKDGTLTPEESHELDSLVLLDDVIGLIQSRIQLPNTEAQSDQHPDERGAEENPTRASGA